MAPLGPFGGSPRLAVAVSGGADSLGLALLAGEWARARGGTAVGLIVDHGLRPESAAEAALTVARLAQFGMDGRILAVHGLHLGPGVAARARVARFAALEAACREDGLLHLLVAHHAADQAETVLMRGLHGSGPAGLAGMAALVETAALRILRPLLAVPPGELRVLLQERGCGWAEDPSNRDARALRTRLRHWRADVAGEGVAGAALAEAAASAGTSRAAAMRATARWLAERVTFWPEGTALLPPGPMPPGVLAGLLRMLGGEPYPPSPARVAALAAAPRPATLGGVRLMPAGRLGDGLLAVREAGRCAGAVPARPGVVWDRRFRLADGAAAPHGAMLAALGRDAARLRGASRLPAAVLAGLPALRQDGRLTAVPHLGWPDAGVCARLPIWFAPAVPAAAAPFVAAAAIRGCATAEATLC